MHIKHIGLDVIRLFKYDEVNGGVIRIIGGYKALPKTASTGYIKYGVTINSVQFQYSAHRLTYLLHYPDMDQTLQVDHINGIKTDNRIENLRLVTHQHNNFNCKTARGFSWDKRLKKFKVYICINYKVRYMGLYDTILDARASYLRAKKKYHIIEER